jgi:SAM-dependent methyltransferase
MGDEHAAEPQLSNLRGPDLPGRGSEFEAFYGQTPPWEIGRPQPALLEVAGGFRGRVLDIGCGSGEHALLAASLGLDAVGLDAAPTPVRLAREKAASRGLDATFVLGDALDLPALFDRPFDTVIDSALFHVFDDADRARFVGAVAAVTAPGARYYLLCFSDSAPGEGGPRRVTEAELRMSFERGWRVDSIDAVELDTIGMDVPAWRAVFVRT